MNRKLRVLGVGLIVFAGLVVGGCGTTGGKVGGSEEPKVIDEGSTDPVVAKAVSIYKSQWLVCHGASFEGRLGSKSSLKQVGSKLTADQIKEKILSGGNGMIAYKGRLQAEEIDALTQWLASKK